MADGIFAAGWANAPTPEREIEEGEREKKCLVSSFLFEGRSILRPAQRFPRNERVNRYYSFTKLIFR